MTYQDFRRIPELRIQINAELIAVENAHEQATSITAHITGMPRGSGGGSQVETAVIRAETHYARYCELCDELHDIYARLTKEYVNIKETERKVIDMFYIQGRKINDIAKEMGLTERQVFRLKKDAMSKLCAPSIYEGVS